MLVFSRNCNQSVVIGDESMEIRVVEIDQLNLRVKFLITATWPAQSLTFWQNRCDEIVISGGLRISVQEIYRDKMKVGIVAPKNFDVHRREVFNAMRRETESGRKPYPKGGRS